MSEEKIYQFNEYVLGYDKGGNDRSALTISKVLNGNMCVMAELYDGSAQIVSTILDDLNKELQQKENIINELEKVLDRNIELNYYKNNVRQYNKTLTEGAIMYRDYIKEKLQELKGDGSNEN